MNNEVYAAIAMALYETMGTAHDTESGVITIKHNPVSSWAKEKFNF